MEDSQLIELFWQKNPEAVSEAAGKYGAYCFAIARRILQSPEDCEECVNDVWLRAWNAIPPQRPGVLRLFLGRVTRNLAFDRLQRQKAEKRGGGEIALVLDELEECIPGPVTVERELEGKALSTAIDGWLRTLPQEDRVLFVRRYWYGVPLQELARERGEDPARLAQRMLRLRKRLKKALEKEGYL